MEQILADIRERVRKATAGETLIPLTAQIHEHAARLAGIPPSRFYTEARTFVEVMLAVNDYYGFDLPRITGDVYNLEVEALGQKLLWGEEATPTVDAADPQIKGPADLDRLRPPDPYASGRMPFILEVNRLFGKLTGLAPVLTFCAPFSVAVGLRGYIPLVRDMRWDPAFAHRLLAFVTEEVLVPWIEVLRREAGVEGERYQPGIWTRTSSARAGAYGADAWASVPHLTLEMIREFVLPYTERLRERCGPVTTGGYWGESHLPRPEELMALKVILLGGEGLVGQDPDLYLLGPERFVAFARQKGVPLRLGLDARLLRDGPIEAIVERVRAYIRAGTAGGTPTRARPLAFSFNSVPADTPPAHVMAAVAAVKQLAAVSPEEIERAAFQMPPVEGFEEFLKKKGALNIGQ